MESTWKKTKNALGLNLNLCVFNPKTLEDKDNDDEEEDSEVGNHTGRLTGSRSLDSGSQSALAMKSSPSKAARSPGSSGIKMSKSGSRSSSKKTCAICLSTTKPGNGHAIFTAECSHTFHFHCIAANVKHGNRVCPVCRADWKEIPSLGPAISELPHGRARVNPINWTQDESYMNLMRRLPRAPSSHRQHQHQAVFQTVEPATFNDDEPVDLPTEAGGDAQQGPINNLEIRTYPEFSAIPKSATEDNFTILIHLKAPCNGTRMILGRTLHSNNSAASLQSSRAPVDLVTVLDISGSMSGTKLALLKRAMGFLIQNLTPSDRLSVVSFSSSARRLFNLRRMTDSGRQYALQAVNSLVSSGGTNIAEGLRKGAKVIEERKEKNPVCSLILLSDGQDTYTVSSSGAAGGVQGVQPDYRSLVPSSIRGDNGTSHQVPVHTFGFGADHDSASMHSISEASGGTFSFIEAEGVIQDAFAQCIGGILSVVVQDLHVNVECEHSGVCLAPIKSGSYASSVVDNGRKGSIEVGDLYADEERDFLVCVNIPAVTCEEVVLLKLGCSYKDLVSKELVTLEGESVSIQRPEVVTTRTVSIEVDREKNRVRAAETMAEARAAAEQGLLSEAVSILEARRRILSESLAGRSGDRLCAALDAELKEMQERMSNRQKYNASGRAYVLSGLSSHSWQRATARGDSTASDSLVNAYQTPTMVDMVRHSQIFSTPARRNNPPVRPTKSLLAQPEPR